MPTLGEFLRLGPFVGGLNRASDPTTLENEELVECINLELDIDGSLVNRVPIQVYETGATNDYFMLFGSVELGGVFYLFGTQSGKTFISTDDGLTWTELNPGVNSRECVTMAVYDNKVWLPATPGSANGGMSWDPVNGAVAVNDMPRGEDCVIHKNRLYICPGMNASSNESRLHFSEAADITTWPSTDFIDVDRGDGTTLNAAVVYQDNLVLFKSESTHILAYDIDPADAILREVNPVLGIKSGFEVVQYENTIFIIHHGRVYEIVNLNFNLVNLKVPFEFDNSMPTNTTARFRDQHIGLLGDRLIARFFNRTYVFNLRTRTWTEWRKTDTSSNVEWHIFGPLVRKHTEPHERGDTYFTSYSFDVSTGGYKLIKINDEHTASETEGFGTNVMDCIITTKDYDMVDPVRYKRLFWWGADILCGNDVTADIQPITLAFVPTWDQLTIPWNQFGTWNRLLSEPSITQTVVPGDGNFQISKAFKFNKGLRFRKVEFSIKITTNGSTTQLSKIFTIIAVVRTKQTVSEQVS